MASWTYDPRSFWSMDRIWSASVPLKRSYPSQSCCSRLQWGKDPFGLTWNRGKVMGCPPPRAFLNPQLVVTVVWSIKLRPTGRSTRCCTPALCRTDWGPIPDCCRMTGVLMDPVETMTSRRALAVYIVPFSSRNSTPVARGVESDERMTLPTFAPDKTIDCRRRLKSGEHYRTYWLGLV